MQDFDKDIRKVGLGGINLDVVDTMLPQEDVRLIRNGRSFDANDTLDGVIRNIKGNTKVPYPFEDFGEGAEVIGTCRDDENNGIIFFVASADNYYQRDAIVEYYPATGVVQGVLYDRDSLVLNFDKNHRIKGAFVIDGLLYWNDGNNGLRKVNLAKAKLTTAGDLVNGYPSLDEQTISLIKYPPVETINPYYFTDSTVKSNNLRGVLFQFRYSYTYDDNEVSVASPISKVALPIGEIDSTGEVVGSLGVNNGLNIRLSTGHHTVKKISIYARIGNEGNWGLVETIDKSKLGLGNDVYYTYSFYNDRVITGVDQEILNKLSHAIPFTSDILAYLHTNELVIGGNTEGFDNLTDIDVLFTPSVKLVNPIITVGVPIQTWPTELKTYTHQFYNDFGELYTITASGQQISGLNSLPAFNSVIKITIDGDVYDFSVGLDESNSTSAFIIALTNVINTSFAPEFAATYWYLPGFNAANAVEPMTLVDSFAIFVYRKPTSSSPANPTLDPNFSVLLEEFDIDQGSYRSYPCWKTGAEQRFGLIYYDVSGRPSFVQDTGSIYLPSFTESSAPIDPYIDKRQNIIYSINWEITHQPPLYATKYQWVRQKNASIIYSIRYIINAVHHGVSDPVVTTDAPSADKSSIDISPLNLHKIQFNGFDFSFPNSSITPYIFQKGDRVRFVTKAKTDFAADGKGLGDLLEIHLDLEILAYQVQTPSEVTPPDIAAPINSIIVQRFDSISKSATIGENTLIEIYRPKLDQEDAIYYEMGVVLNVLNPGTSSRAHEGTVIDQNITDGISAKGEFINGDAYMVPTVFDKNLALNIEDRFISMNESSSASNYYDQKIYDIGRPNIVNEKAEQKKSLSLRSSGKYFEGTEINGLSEFYGDTDIPLSAEFGNTITGLNEVGFTVKVLQKRKRTSLFVGRTGLQLASGSDTDQILANSDSGLTTKSPAEEARGCSNPESVIVVERYLFFVDVRNGVIVRDAANGQVDIDKYGVTSDIKRICNELQTKFTSSRILSSYNPITNEVGFSFTGIKASGETHFGTYYFKVEKNKWSEVFDYMDASGKSPSAFASINQSYISFIGTQIWLHETNRLYNNFYGIQRPLVVEVIFNKASLYPKLFKTIEIVGKGEWSCPNNGDIKIEAKNAVINRDQTSRLASGKFKNVKGKKVAVLMKDMNTQNGINATSNLFNGNDLKGSVLFVRLTNTESTLSIIDSVATLYQTLKLS